MEVGSGKFSYIIEKLPTPIFPLQTKKHESNISNLETK